MRIGRVVIQGLRALESRDDILATDGVPWPAACLRGLNGSGKTTWLRAVAEMWAWFRDCARRGVWVEPSGALIQEAVLIAVHFRDLLAGRDIWLVWGGEQPRTQFMEGLGACFAPESLVWGRGLPDVVLLEPGLGQDRLGAMVGTIKLVDDARFRALQHWFAELLPGLTLHGFDPTTQQPRFRVARSGALISIDHLSAGERLMLFNLATVHQLGNGGIALLDDIGMHQHISTMGGSVAVLEDVVTRNGGQLIVASHAPEVWEQFRGRGSLVDLSPTGVK